MQRTKQHAQCKYHTAPFETIGRDWAHPRRAHPHPTPTPAAPSVGLAGRPDTTATPHPSPILSPFLSHCAWHWPQFPMLAICGCRDVYNPLVFPSQVRYYMRISNVHMAVFCFFIFSIKTPRWWWLCMIHGYMHTRGSKHR